MHYKDALPIFLHSSQQMQKSSFLLRCRLKTPPWRRNVSYAIPVQPSPSVSAQACRNSQTVWLETIWSLKTAGKTELMTLSILRCHITHHVIAVWECEAVYIIILLLVIPGQAWSSCCPHWHLNEPISCLSILPWVSLFKLRWTVWDTWWGRIRQRESFWFKYKTAWIYISAAAEQMNCVIGRLR